MTAIQQIEMSKIKPGQNDRTLFDTLELADLAQSIATDGLIQPITVRPIDIGEFEIVAGERRYRACQSLGWHTIPAIVKPMEDRQASKVMLLENVQRADLDPIDEAHAYQSRMTQFNLSVSEVADWAKVTDSKVRSRINLLKLIPEIQHLIRSGNMPLNFASEMIGLDKNYQLIAFRYFGQAKRPNITEFKALCSDLENKQNQLCMFDMAEFMTQPIEQTLKTLEICPQTVKTAVFRLFGVKVTLEYTPISLGVKYGQKFGF